MLKYREIIICTTIVVITKSLTYIIILSKYLFLLPLVLLFLFIIFISLSAIIKPITPPIDKYIPISVTIYGNIIKRSATDNVK